MTFELEPLPFAIEGLAPHISKETLEYHHGKHHQAYVNKLNDLLPGTEFENMSLEDLVLKADGGIFNNAAQIWNHNFYWQSLSDQDEAIDPQVQGLLDEYFGSIDLFKKEFTKQALGQFGSGWAWLVLNEKEQLEIMTTSNADNPLCHGKKPLLTCDVWEHAYYIDTRNSRPNYLNNYWEVVNWNLIKAQLNA